jgi:hypothetical protein
LGIIHANDLQSQQMMMPDDAWGLEVHAGAEDLQCRSNHGTGWVAESGRHLPLAIWRLWYWCRTAQAWASGRSARIPGSHRRRQARGKRLGAIIVAAAIPYGTGHAWQRFAAIIIRPPAAHQAHARQRLLAVIIWASVTSRRACRGSENSAKEQRFRPQRFYGTQQHQDGQPRLGIHR